MPEALPHNQNSRLRTIFTKLFAALIITTYILCFSNASHAEKNIVVIPKATILHFWKIVCTGAHAAAEGKDINLIWRGPRVENKTEAQQHLLDFYIDKKVDAIVIAPSDKKRLDPYIKKAVKKGIKVVVIDSPVSNDAADCYIATGNNKAGAQGAELLAAQINAKGPVLLIGHNPDNGAAFQREKGFINKIQELLPGRTIIRLHMIDGSERETRIVVEELLQRMPGIAGIFSVNELTSDGVYYVLKSNNYSIPFVAFDYNEKLIRGVEEGRIKALITQKPYAMGYFGVSTAIELIEGKAVPKQMESPTTVITSENLELLKNIRCLRNMTEAEKKKCPICFN